MTFSDRLFVAVAELESLTFTTKLKSPRMPGDPLINPVALFRDIPAGRNPEVMLQV